MNNRLDKALAQGSFAYKKEKSRQIEQYQDPIRNLPYRNHMVEQDEQLEYEASRIAYIYR